MLSIKVRDRPCSARCVLLSEARTTFSTPSVRSTVMPSGTVCSSSPLGPFTLTLLPLIVTVTVAGTGTGRRPIRDIFLSLSDSPDFADELAAYAEATCLLSRYHALRGG